VSQGKRAKHIGRQDPGHYADQQAGVPKTGILATGVIAGAKRTCAVSWYGAKLYIRLQDASVPGERQSR